MIFHTVFSWSEFQDNSFTKIIQDMFTYFNPFFFLPMFRVYVGAVTTRFSPAANGPINPLVVSRNYVLQFVWVVRRN